MLVFLLVYFSIYGGANAYILWKAHLGFPLHGWRMAAAWAFVALMVSGPILERLFLRHGYHLAATGLAYVSYTWMAVVLWSFFLLLARDMWNLLVKGASLAAPPAASLSIPARPYLLACAVIILAATAWGAWEARAMRVERLTLRTPHLAPSAKPLKVAQISDVHFGILEGKGRLSTILGILDRERPDILVSTGDLVDGLVLHLNHLAEDLARFTPPLGKFAVTGNHEYYAGLAESLAFHREAGFRVLRGESVAVGGIRIAGVDDPAAREMRRGESLTDEDAVLPVGARSEFTILLKHRPLLAGGSAGRFDLQLSGHTHRGQIFPFNHLVRLQFPYPSGLFDLAQGSALYTSRGTGTWGPPLRLLSPPEVTIVTIVPSEG